ncbi:unnamed protein product [Tenebrio molitor]|nr:unnamed protein product [Tenebrio molitor]
MSKWGVLFFFFFCSNTNFFSFSNKNKSPKIYRQCILILVDK